MMNYEETIMQNSKELLLNVQITYSTFEKEDSGCMDHGGPLELRDPMLPSAQLTVQIITGLLHFYMKMEARSC